MHISPSLKIYSVVFTLGIAAMLGARFTLFSDEYEEVVLATEDLSAEHYDDSVLLLNGSTEPFSIDLLTQVEIIPDEQSSPDSESPVSSTPSRTTKIESDTPTESSPPPTNTHSSSLTTTSSRQLTAEPAEPKQEDSADVATVQVSLKVSVPGGKSGSYSLRVNQGSTVEQVMHSAKSQGFSYTTSGYSSLGSYVKSVQGVAEDTKAGMYWVYSLNGQKAYAGISTQKVKSGDTITWTYEKSY